MAANGEVELLAANARAVNMTIPSRLENDRGNCARRTRVEPDPAGGKAIRVIGMDRFAWSRRTIRVGGGRTSDEAITPS